MDIPTIVSRLEKAAAAYYNTGVSIMTDDEYDTLREELAELDPNHPFLKRVGAAVSGSQVNLPVPMPSLNKIKPGSVNTWRTSHPSSSWILSEKLDGISALWIPREKKLFLRGDGLVGQDVSHIARLGIVGLPLRIEKGFMVRGEIVMRKADTPSGTIGRSWINGLLHQKEPSSTDVQKIRFVAYEIVSDDKMIRQEQFENLKKRGYELPWYCVISDLHEQILAQHLNSRRESGDYDIDGIVVGKNCVPEWHSSPMILQNPKDMVAFKMVLSDQCADTTVVAVHWAVSRQGYLIPRIEIEPVRVGGALITYLTGHNAKVIAEKKIGKGARIRIRRSGDVIPTLEAVIQEAQKVELPCNTWDENKVHLVQKEDTKGILESRLVHFASTFEMDGVGPGQVKKLMESGIQTPWAFLQASETKLQEILGKKTGVKVFAEIGKIGGKMTEKRLMLASSVLPRGVGDTKISTLFAIESDPRKWKDIRSAEGWSSEALSEFLLVLQQYELWRQKEFPAPTYPILTSKVEKKKLVEHKGNICFTGFRDSALEKQLQEKGYTIQSGVNGKTNILVIPDEGDHTSTSKYTAAMNLKTVEILKKGEILRRIV